MTRILFVHNRLQPFVADDLKILQERWSVTERYEARRRVNPFEIAREVRRNDLIFCWFASWHSALPIFFARVFHKPSIVVIGGYDTANVPEADYGSQRGGWRQRLSRWIIANATHLIVNSEFARSEALANTHTEPGKLTVMYHGIVPKAPGPFTEREALALTVGNVWKENLLRKGLLPFVRSSRLLPDVRFVVVGKCHDDTVDILRAEGGPNVEFTGFVSEEALWELYRRASVYVQPSIHEAFGLSVAEAMSAGCIPVVTAAGALPEVVGNTGIIVPTTAPEDIATGIQQALHADSAMRSFARERVLTEFPMERRRDAMQMLITRLTTSASTSSTRI